MRATVVLFLLAGLIAGLGLWSARGDKQSFTVVNERDHDVYVWGMLRSCEDYYGFEDERLRFELARPHTSHRYSYRSSPVIDAGIKCVYLIDDESQLLLKEPFEDDRTYVATRSLVPSERAPDSLQYRSLSWSEAIFSTYVWSFAVAALVGIVAGLTGLYHILNWWDRRT